MSFVKKLMLWGVVAGILYALLSYHFLYFGGTRVRLLKKSELTLHYTFYSVAGKTNKMVMSKDVLREDGIGPLLVEMGRMTEEEREKLLEKYEH